MDTLAVVGSVCSIISLFWAICDYISSKNKKK